MGAAQELIEAHSTIPRIGEIMGRSPDEVLSLMESVLLWVLHEQMCGRRIISVTGKTHEWETELANLEADPEAARRYFEESRWEERWFPLSPRSDGV